MKNYPKKLAALALDFGLVFEKGQRLLVSADMAHRDFVHLLAEEAYKRGARYVEVEWRDQKLSRIRLDHSGGNWDYVPSSLVAGRRELVESCDALIALRGNEDPKALEGANSQGMGEIGKATGEALAFYRKAAMSKKIPWTIIPVPTLGWAKAVLGPEKNEFDLWEILGKILKLNEENPLAAWTQRTDELDKLIQKVNSLSLDRLIFETGETYFEVGLLPSSHWIAGRDESPLGKKLMVNIPSEEAFTSPDFRRTKGKVHCSRPVEVLGALVEGAWFVFDQGKVIDFGAKKNEEVLKAFLEIDPQAAFLGEIALVDKHSPIFKSGVVFQDILLDENAACHFALGGAYPDGAKDAKDKEDHELLEMGLNVSRVHIDFMFGTPDILVTGVLTNGDRLPIMKEGEFVLNES